MSFANMPNNEKSRKYMMLGLRIMGDFGATIAVPIILFVLAAQWLENKYGGAPYLTIFAFFLAAVLSGMSIYKKAKAYDREYKKLNELEEQIPKKDN